VSDGCIILTSARAHNTVLPRTSRQLELRLERFEIELAELTAAIAQNQGRPWYRQIVGAFAGDPALAEITRFGRLIRQGKKKG
jgi:hypothetical protein